MRHQSENRRRKFCNRKTRRGDGKWAVGFTLLEILVVLALIGVMAGIALPNFARFLDSFTTANKWSALERELSGLSYRAFATGVGLRLDTANAPKLLAAIPEGWRIDVSVPIIYRASGWCEGGQITIISAAAERRRYQLVAPACLAKAPAR